MSALGRPQDMFSDTAIQLQPIFAQWIQNTHFLAPQFTAPNALAATSVTWGGDIVAVGGKVAMMPISLGTSDFLVCKMVDQVKLRYMLEQSILFRLHKKTKEGCKFLNSYFIIICNFTCSPYLRFQLTPFLLTPTLVLVLLREQKRKEGLLTPPLRVLEGFEKMVLGIRENLSGRINQQVTAAAFFKDKEPAFKNAGTSETTREASMPVLPGLPALLSHFF